MKKTTMKKVGAIALAAGVAFAGGVGAGFVMDQPKDIEVVKEVEVIKTVEVPGPTMTVTEIKEVPVEVPVEVEKIVEVPMPGSDEIVEFVIDQDGDLTELDLDEIEDHGFDALFEQVMFIRESKMMAADYAEREAADELDKFSFNATLTFDEDDIDRVRVDDDLDEIEISDVDFEDKDADVRVRVRFEHDDVDFEAYFDVEIKDGRIDDIELDSSSVKQI